VIAARSAITKNGRQAWTNRPLPGSVQARGRVRGACHSRRRRQSGGIIGSEPNARRHVISNERDMPWRLAVDDIARGA